MSEKDDTSGNKMQFTDDATDSPVKHEGETVELDITVGVEPSFNDPVYWSVVLHATVVDPQTLEAESHNIAKIEKDRSHDDVHFHRNYRRGKPRDFDVDIDDWIEAMDALKANCRRYFSSYADAHL